MVGGPLPADARVLARLAARDDGHLQHRLDRVVALVERRCDRASRVAVDGEGQLRHVVGADREPVEVLEESFGEDRVGRNLAHHDHAKPVTAALEPLFLQKRDHHLRFLERAHERDHQLDVREAHRLANALHRGAFEGEAIVEFLRNVTSRAAEPDHRILLVRFIALAAHQVRILVRFEVRQTDDHLLGPKRRCDSRDPLGDLAHVELGRALVATDALADLALQVRRLTVELEQRLRVDADVLVDDEFETREPDAFVRQAAELERELRIADVHHELGRHRRHLVERHFNDLDVELAFVHMAGVALGARHGDVSAVRQGARRIAASDHGRDAEFARDDRSVARASAAIGDDRSGPLHDRLPVGVGHVGDQHVARLDLLHLRGGFDEAHGALADLLSNRASGSEDLRGGLQGIFVNIRRCSTRRMFSLAINREGFVELLNSLLQSASCYRPSSALSYSSQPNR